MEMANESMPLWEWNIYSSVKLETQELVDKVFERYPRTEAERFWSCSSQKKARKEVRENEARKILNER